MAERALLTDWVDSCSRMGAGAYYFVRMAALTATGSESFAAPVTGKVAGLVIGVEEAHTGTNYVTVELTNEGNGDATMMTQATSGGLTANKGAGYLNLTVSGDEECTLGDVIKMDSTESGTLAAATYIWVVFESID